MSDQLVWTLERLENPRFPYRVRVVRGDEVLLALRVRQRKKSPEDEHGSRVP